MSAQPELHRTSVDVPLELWSFYQGYKSKTRKSFASFVIEALRELQDDEKEAEARDLELLKARRLARANRHLG